MYVKHIAHIQTIHEKIYDDKRTMLIMDIYFDCHR